MKKMKILPLVLTLPLLVGCSKNSISPRFAKEGEKVAYEAFNEGLEADMKASVFFSEEEGFVVPSFKAEITMNVMQSETFKRDGKEAESQVAYAKNKAIGQVDSTNGIIKGKVQGDTKVEVKTPNNTMTQHFSQTETSVIQKATLDGGEFMVEIDLEKKTYKTEHLIDETHPYNTYFNEEATEAMSMPLMLLMLLEMSYSFASDEEKAKYNFYKNDKIYTAEYSQEKSEETKNGEDVVTKVVTEKSYTKIQLDLRKAEVLKGAFYMEETETTEYKVDDSSYFAGDVREEVMKQGFEETVKKADVSLKAEDISQYKKVN